MKKWTIRDAWKAKFGAVVKPIEHTDLKATDVTEVDRSIASALGLRSLVSMKKIHAALVHAMPLLTTNSLPRSTSKKHSLRHAADHAISCVKAFCKEDGIPRSEYQDVIDALKSLNFSQLCAFDWFLISDAMAMEGTIEDQDCKDFYEYAVRSWHYASLAEENRPVVAKAR